MLVQVEAGLMPEDLPRRPKEHGAADKENARDPKSKTQRPEKFAGAQASKGKGKTKAKTGPAPSHLPVSQVQSDSGSEDGQAFITWCSHACRCRLTTAR